MLIFRRLSCCHVVIHHTLAAWHAVTWQSGLLFHCSSYCQRGFLHPFIFYPAVSRAVLTNSHACNPNNQKGFAVFFSRQWKLFEQTVIDPPVNLRRLMLIISTMPLYNHGLEYTSVLKQALSHTQTPIFSFKNNSYCLSWQHLIAKYRRSIDKGSLSATAVQ